MPSRMVRALSAMVVAGFPGAGATGAAALQAPVVVSAYVEPDSVISFTTPVELPWAALAPARLGRAALERDTAGLRRLSEARDMFGNTDLAFPLPVPPDLAQRHYYLLDSTGAHTLVPSRLLGTARLGWAGDDARLAGVLYFGELQAPAPPGSSGGFVLISTTPLGLVVSESSLSPDSLLGPNGGDYPGRGTAFRTIVRQYRVTGSPDPYIWVQWAPDTAMFEIGCSFRFSLFPARAPGEPVAETSYGCDV